MSVLENESHVRSGEPPPLRRVPTKVSHYDYCYIIYVEQSTMPPLQLQTSLLLNNLKVIRLGGSSLPVLGVWTHLSINAANDLSRNNKYRDSVDARITYGYIK